MTHLISFVSYLLEKQRLGAVLRPVKIVRAGMLVLVTLCAACGTLSPKDFSVRGEAEALLNPSESGKPLSLVVRVYQLKSRQAFNRLTSEQLASGRSDQELLGADLVESQDLLVLPNDAVEARVTVNKDTQFVALVGFYRRPDPHFWRLLFDADEVRRNGLKFNAKQCYLESPTVPVLLIPGQPPSRTSGCPTR